MHSQPLTQRHTLTPTQPSPTREPAGITSCLPHRCSTSTPPASAPRLALPLDSASTQQRLRTFHCQQFPRRKRDADTSCPDSPTILSVWAGFATQTAPPSWIKPASLSTTPPVTPFFTDSATKRDLSSGDLTSYRETHPHVHPWQTRPQLAQQITGPPKQQNDPTICPAREPLLNTSTPPPDTQSKPLGLQPSKLEITLHGRASHTQQPANIALTPTPPSKATWSRRDNTSAQPNHHLTFNIRS